MVKYDGTFVKKTFSILKEYCKNSSLAGVGYIVNDRLHISERLFWLICIIISSFGSYHLVNNYLNTLDQNSISLVIENVSPHDITKFPSIGVCELADKLQEYDKLTNIVNSLRENEDIPYSLDVEQYLEELIFVNLYKVNQLGTFCTELLNTNDKIKCPTGNYSKIADIVRADCKELFVSCKWNGVIFDCCQHFLPLRCTVGICFLLNSIQTEDNKSKWIDLIADRDNGNGLLELTINKPIKIHILNEEDIPFITLASLTEIIDKPGVSIDMKVNVQNIINDPGVENIPSIHRKCLFPNENPKDSAYKFYSFSTCITDCLKKIQIKHCNCSNFYLITNENDKTPPCGLNGFRCLDENNLIAFGNRYLQPWYEKGLSCECQTSCNENELEIVQRSQTYNPEEKISNVSITLQSLPTERYRRQAVRGNLDVVVTIGGILGLFLGASIISIIEFIYFLTYRVFKFIFMK